MRRVVTRNDTYVLAYLHHLKTKDSIYQVSKVEFCSKKPMRLTFIEGPTHEIDLLVWNQSTWLHNWSELNDISPEVNLGYIQGEAHKVLQRDITQTIDHIQKAFWQKFQCSRMSSFSTTLLFIGGGTEAMSRSTPIFEMEPCIFFDGIINDFKTNSATYNTRSF